MYRTSSRRLPGIRFKVEPPVPEEALPRMDITAFVGFAASGPLDVPVAVEDMKRFRDIFGKDLALARDGKTGEQQYAHLAPAVEAFLKNGGKRCWIVRAAGKGAVENCFPVPGLVEAGTDDAVIARARSEGSWSDSLRVGTVLNRDRLTVLDFQCQTSAYSLEVVSLPGQVEVGDLVRVEWKSDGNNLVLFMAVDTIKTGTPSQSGGKHRAVQYIKGSKGFWFEMSGTTLSSLSEADGISRWESESVSSPPEEAGAYRLTFDLLVWDGETVTARMRRLGFYAKHPRFWARLPMDRSLFVTDPGTVRAIEAGSLAAEAAEPRFPLAGPSGSKELYLPKEMAQLPGYNFSEGACSDISVDTALKRDGLETFDTSVFYDSKLVDFGIDVLIEEANRKYLLNEKREPLKGFHSLLPLEEVTVVSLPDALHREWEARRKTPVSALDAPVLKMKKGDSQENGGTERSIFLEWELAEEEQVPDACIIYTLQESDEPLFLKPVTVYSGTDTSVPVVSCTACAHRYFYRVYARFGDRSSPWSNTLDVTLPEEAFADCAQPPLIVPDLEILPVGSLPGGEYELKWSEITGASGYVLEESEDPVFAAGVVIYEGKNTSFSLTCRTGENRVYYYRVRAKDIALCAWSDTETLVNTGKIEWVLKSTDDYAGDRLLELQHALLRFCAARGDIMAVLTLPRHYREEETLAHVEALGTVKESEKKMLSFGALYHPWVSMGIESMENAGKSGSVMRYVPPDGAVCGSIADRALIRGAWIAPANQPLQGVTALTPVIHPHYREKLYDEQVNIICGSPRGFMLLSADTLSPGSDLRPINVRRLLILLRRLALREGMTYVFQPNTPDFQRRVKYRFEQMLARMFTRGAFAGDTPETSFRVVTDSSVNPPSGMERGRFVVELRVAPSLPMTFITVRLVQTHDEGIFIKEVG